LPFIKIKNDEGNISHSYTTVNRPMNRSVSVKFLGKNKNQPKNMLSTGAA